MADDEASLPGLLLSSGELIPLSIIRTETALSRFPIHRLVKKGDVKIEIRNQSSALLWEVTYNSKYGQPGPLAYKLDTLVVNKRIEEAGHPVPRLLRLGSLRDICRELGNSEGGESTQAIRNALMQNASAFINAKITYRTTDRSERSLEAGFTRYSVLFTGETLPDGCIADAVYLQLNEPYWQVMDAALTRPLDYKYMHSLPPAAQRFYEIVSYQIYGALFHKNERARLRYSEYCMLSTAIRYLTFDQVKKQMYKIHRPHLESGYLAKVAYEQTSDDTGQPDWWMYYVPGPNASREYQQFNGNVRKTKERSSAGRTSGVKEFPKYAPAGTTGTAGASLFLPFPEADTDGKKDGEAGADKPPNTRTRSLLSSLSPSGGTTLQRAANPKDSIDPDTAVLIAHLVAADLDPATAERFARERPEECRRQLEWLPFVAEFKESRGAYLYTAIELPFRSPPKAYLQHRKDVEARQKQQIQLEQQKAIEATRRAAEAAESLRVEEDMARLETEAPEAFLAFTGYLSEKRQLAEKQYARMSASIRTKALKHWDLPEKRQEEFKIWQKLTATRNQAVSLAKTGVSQSSEASALPPLFQGQDEEDASVVRSLIQQALTPPSDEPESP